jgi:hypothetical protein
MTRHGLFAILALTGLSLAIPDPTAARPSFRPAFTGGPYRIVLPTGRPHVSGAPHIHGSTIVPRSGAAKPAAHSAAAGLSASRRHHRFYGSYGSTYPVTYGAGGDYYGSPYDPSDIPLSVASTDDPPAPVLAAPPPEQIAHRGCRAQHVLVPMATGRGESEVTIIRC